MDVQLYVYDLSKVRIEKSSISSEDAYAMPRESPARYKAPVSCSSLSDLVQASASLLGIQIDAVYHTSLVFGGIEFFFGGGVQRAYPGRTHHGAPMEIVNMGRTELPSAVILEYLESLKEIYTAEVRSDCGEDEGRPILLTGLEVLRPVSSQL